MAGSKPSISRRRVLGAAAALPISALISNRALPTPALAASADRKLWNRRLARYRRLSAQAEEAATTGWFRAANDRHARDMAAAKARFGSNDKAQASPEGRAICKAIWRRIDEAEDAYWRRCTKPMQRAAVAVARTPAPDLEALRAKIAVMREQQLDELDLMRQSPLRVLEEDVERFALNSLQPHDPPAIRSS